MKQGWEIKKLGDVCELYQPKTISSKEMVDDGDYPVFGANGIIGKYDKYNHEEPQLLITCRGATCGSINISEPKSWINGNAMVVRPKDNSLNLKFIEYLFLGGIDISKTITGAAQPQITRQTLSPVLISYPKSLPEQQRIVAILDEAFTAIAKAKANAEQNLKNAKELFESYLQGVFENKDEDWEKKSLGEIATFRNGMNFTKSSKGEKINIVGVKDFQNSFWVPFETLETVVLDGKLNEFDLLREGDILAVRSNGNPQLIGRTLIANKVEGKVSHSGFTIRIRLNSENIDPIYLCNYLKIPKTRKILVDGGNGVGIKSLNQGSLSALIIPFPKSLKEQQIIVQKLDTISTEIKKLEAIYQQKINDLEELKKSVLQKAFSGELKVSELGFIGLKDERIVTESKILQSTNPKNHTSDNDGLKDVRIVKKDKEEILQSTNPKNHNSDNDGLKDNRIVKESKILKSTNPKNHNSDNDGLKDERIVKNDKEEILQSTNLKNHTSDNDGLKDERIVTESKILQSTNPKNHNSDNDGLKDDRIVKNDKEEILQSTNLKNHNSDNNGLKDERIVTESKILQSTNPKNHNSDNDGLKDDRIKMNA